MLPPSASRPVIEHLAPVLHGPVVPAEAAWARYVLLAIVWFFVIAVLTGPVERWLRSRKAGNLPRSRPRW
jgi:hypothetical protein